MLKLTGLITFSMLIVFESALRAQPTTAPTTAPTGIARAEIRVRRPPPSGAPRGEGTAASRGDDSDLPQPILFAENEGAGRTISTNPTLYFYIPAATTNPAVVRLADPQAKLTLARHSFEQGFAKPGIYRVQLSELKEPLRPDVHYSWDVSIKSPKGNAHNAMTVAYLMYQPDAAVAAQLANRSAEERARILGESGIWYDAIAALSEAIDANPTDTFLRAERTRLLTERNKENAAAFEQMPGSR